MLLYFIVRWCKMQQFHLILYTRHASLLFEAIYEVSPKSKFAYFCLHKMMKSKENRSNILSKAGTAIFHSKNVAAKKNHDFFVIFWRTDVQCLATMLVRFICNHVLFCDSANAIIYRPQSVLYVLNTCITSYY